MNFGLLHSLLQLTTSSLFGALLSIFLASLCAGVREPVEQALFIKEEEDMGIRNLIGQHFANCFCVGCATAV